MNRFTVLVVARLLFQPRDRALESLHVGEDQFGFNDLDIGSGVDVAVDVHDVVVIEDPDDLTDRVALADVGQELVAQAGALRGALDDAGDVDEGHRCRDDAFGSEHLGQPGQPGVGQRNHTLIGLDGGEGVVGRQYIVAGQRIEQGRFSDVGQTDDSQAQAHRVKSLGGSPNQHPASGAPQTGRGNRGDTGIGAAGCLQRQPVRSSSASPADGRSGPALRVPPPCGGAMVGCGGDCGERDAGGSGD